MSDDDRERDLDEIEAAALKIFHDMLHDPRMTPEKAFRLGRRAGKSLLPPTLINDWIEAKLREEGVQVIDLADDEPEDGNAP